MKERDRCYSFVVSDTGYSDKVMSEVPFDSEVVQLGDGFYGVVRHERVAQHRVHVQVLQRAERRRRWGFSLTTNTYRSFNVKVK
jgi:hypothetical protein